MDRIESLEEKGSEEKMKVRMAGTSPIISSSSSSTTTTTTTTMSTTAVGGATTPTTSSLEKVPSLSVHLHLKERKDMEEWKMDAKNLVGYALMMIMMMMITI